jgi:hypothetical protein
MKPAEKNQLTIIVIAIVIALFVPFVYLRSSADVQFANDMVSRANLRMQRRHIDVKPPTVSAATLEREIVGIRQEIESSRAALAEFRARFAAVGDGDQQMIKLEISQLAQDNEVVVDGLVFDSPDRVSQFGRPIISLQAHGSFQAAQAFLRGLPRLSRSVTVVRFSMETATAKSGIAKKAPQSSTDKNVPPPSPPDAAGVRLDLQLAI